MAGLDLHQTAWKSSAISQDKVLDVQKNCRYIQIIGQANSLFWLTRFKLA
jgi:hypothetical protein